MCCRIHNNNKSGFDTWSYLVLTDYKFRCLTMSNKKRKDPWRLTCPPSVLMMVVVWVVVGIRGQQVGLACALQLRLLPKIIPIFFILPQELGLPLWSCSGVRIIVGDAEFEPGTSGPWCAIPMSDHIYVSKINSKEHPCLRTLLAHAPKAGMQKKTTRKSFSD